MSGPRKGGPRKGGPRKGDPQADGAQTGGPQADGPRRGDPQADGAQTGGPQADGAQKDDPSRGGPLAMVIFGATGDLTRRKLAPALYELARAACLPDDLHLVGFARRDWGDAQLAEALAAGVREHGRTQPPDEALLAELLAHVHYVRASFDDGAGYRELAAYLEEIGAARRLFYLAAPPDSYETIIDGLEAAELGSAPEWARVVVEKPFGRDAASARELNATIERVFAEPQIYRIDHYLGKETVQNILALRFANGIFEPLWNRNYIHHVQILVAESEGVGTRAGYYESAGVVRDMFQNHLLQLLTLTAMEAPVEFAADPVRDEKVKVLRALRSLAEDGRTTFRAQYGPGEVDGERVPGYLEEEGVAPDSRTETLLAACLWVDNWRWAGVPFYLRSGKRLPERRTEIAIQFKQAPLSLFGGHSFVDEAPNRLVLHLQPDEGITLSFGAKAPGGQMEIVPVEMAFDYAATFHAEPPEAYERLLLDALQGDPTLFTRWDETLVAWEFTDEIIRTWAADDAPLPTYPAGSWGPPGMDDFIRSGGCAWRAIPPLRAA